MQRGVGSTSASVAPFSTYPSSFADAGFCVEPTVDALTERLDAALGGARPKTAPVDHAQKYDWDAIAAQAETAYRRAIDGTW
jgi:hypothetical protein